MSAFETTLIKIAVSYGSEMIEKASLGRDESQMFENSLYYSGRFYDLLASTDPDKTREEQFKDTISRIVCHEDKMRLISS